MDLHGEGWLCDKAFPRRLGKIPAAINRKDIIQLGQSHVFPWYDKYSVIIEPYMIALENVRLRFDPRGIAGLSGVNLILPEGTITALMGPNGSGKTTLLRILSGELSPESGAVKTEELVVYMKPENVPSPLNVQKYLMGKVKAEIDDEKKIQLSRDLADIFEFTFQLRQTVGELSAGQRQKVMLAGELIRNPKLILLDEPFTHLDPHTRKEIIRSLFEYVRRQSITLLWVTHDLNEAARYSDKLVLLQHGKIEQEGSPEEIIKSPRNIFTAQFVGYHNFFPVKKKADVWATPWGDHAFDFPFQQEEALLVVPDTSWERSASSVRARIEEQYLRDTMWTTHARWEEKTIIVQTMERPGKVGEQLTLIPRFSECFLIPL
jgi:ABC-type Fe3+/spermidine/putrescine transport system ATPase subunit